MTITISLLATIIGATSPTTGAFRDLCDTIDPATGVPLLCEPYSDEAPTYDGIVCCDDELCEPAPSSGCRDGEPHYCELGERRSDGRVTCYFVVPDYCELFACDEDSPPLEVGMTPLEGVMCCHAGVCWNYWLGSGECELGDIYWCSDGATHEDGTVDCFD